ncbi:MAG: ATP-binding cassette domain-containing protein, partial [Actinomycetota bacterium]|nr:ATP-binding cassette domain-containing protein [Actinomycetota bacterium]
MTITERPEGLDVEHLTVRRPDGAPLVENLTLHLSPGQTLLVTGTSGCSKTTLLRSLADLWPYAHGTVRRPTARHALFLPQHPYLPPGRPAHRADLSTLPHVVGDEQVHEALRMVQLGHVENQIDDEVNWSRILFTGEHQH